MTVTELVKEVFNEPRFRSYGIHSDFMLRSGSSTHRIQITRLEDCFDVLEYLDAQDKVGVKVQSFQFKNLQDLKLYLTELYKSYPNHYEFIQGFCVISK